MVLCVCPEHDLDTHCSKGWNEEPVTQLIGKLVNRFAVLDDKVIVPG